MQLHRILLVQETHKQIEGITVQNIPEHSSESINVSVDLVVVDISFTLTDF